jgi:hypothetical protein
MQAPRRRRKINWDLQFSRRWSWRYLSSGMWHRLDLIIHQTRRRHVSEDSSHQNVWAAINDLHFEMISVGTIRSEIETALTSWGFPAVVWDFHFEIFLWSGLEIREYCHRDQSRLPRSTLYPQNLALISPTSGGRSVSIFRSRTKVTELLLLLVINDFCGDHP